MSCSHCSRCLSDNLHDVGSGGDVGEVPVLSLQLLRQPGGGNESSYQPSEHNVHERSRHERYVRWRQSHHPHADVLLLCSRSPWRRTAARYRWNQLFCVSPGHYPSSPRVPATRGRSTQQNVYRYEWVVCVKFGGPRSNGPREIHKKNLKTVPIRVPKHKTYGETCGRRTWMWAFSY